ncbi:DUF423 domain-containing protein [Rhodovibrio salinarum]|uniref:DUF423 domain-containing protein n=1 Tax=Rhodovibrio salinarum TaxID=1087 RepID=A0A934QIN7_9PROT|nr:DUF423 domain-containing protein [Rhodovibrio salinarum]MBK1697265.1 DUF423 domain-containing protein [Rhodovibrio salinarum]
MWETVNKTARAWLLCAGVYGFLSVAIGAFAAHGLESSLDAMRLGWIETGARYQALHALALVGVALLQGLAGARIVRPLVVAGVGFAVGGLLFPGGLYLAALLGWTFLIPVVPVGGGAFLVGWLALAWTAIASKR